MARRRHLPVRIPRSQRTAVSHRARQLVREGYSPSYAAKVAYHGRDPARSRKGVKFYVTHSRHGYSAVLLDSRGHSINLINGGPNDSESTVRAAAHKHWPGVREVRPSRDPARVHGAEDVYDDDYVLSRDHEGQWYVVRAGNREALIGTAPSQTSALALATKHARTRGRLPVVVFYATNHGLQKIRTISRDQAERDPRVSAAKRRSLHPSQFALPARRALPIHDAKHARNAASRLAQMHTRGTITEREYRSALARVRAAERHFGIHPRGDSVK